MMLGITFRACSSALFDLSESAAAELTGALVIDRARNFGICGLSNRADEAGSRNMHEAFDLKLTLNSPLRETEYHTNVVLAILAGKLSIIAPSAFETEEVRTSFADAYGDNSRSNSISNLEHLRPIVSP